MSTEIFVLTGPESCGKTTLAEQLAEHFQVPLVPEIAREYILAQASTHYRQSDLLKIAQRQHTLEQKLLSQQPEKLICDTDLLVIIIWSEVKYGQCEQWIYQSFEKNIEQLSCKRHYFLCHWDVPWQPDPLRENAGNREQLYSLYLRKLEQYKLPFTLVKGDNQQRLQEALQFISL